MEGIKNKMSLNLDYLYAQKAEIDNANKLSVILTKELIKILETRVKVFILNSSAPFDIISDYLYYFNGSRLSDQGPSSYELGGSDNEYEYKAACYLSESEVKDIKRQVEAVAKRLEIKDFRLDFEPVMKCHGFWDTLFNRKKPVPNTYNIHLSMTLRRR